MNAPASPLLASPRPTGDLSARVAEARLSAAEVDASCRRALLLLFVSGAIWLVLGIFLALISSIKLHAPGFLAGPAWLTLGRVRPAAMNAILYGFASQAGLGVLLWLFCRLGRMRLLFQPTLLIGIAFWNLGVTLGIIGILAGDTTGFEWLEMPSYVPPMLFVSYALIGVCAMSAFYLRRERALYVSHWYLLAALFWFPWIYSAASLLLIFHPVRGVVQSIVDAWFSSSFLVLWLGPISLGAIFYFIPKLTGRPLYSRSLAAFGFWTLAFFGNWAGPAKLVGGPVPAWIASTGIAANLLLLIPLISVAINWHQTLRGLYSQVKEDLALRFTVIGAASYLLASLLNIVLSLREVSAVTHLTYVEAGQVQLALLGFVAMTLFGSIHYIVPRVMNVAWPCQKLLQTHFWGSAVGIALIVVGLMAGGVVQGLEINNPSVPFINVVRSTVPFLGIGTLGELVLLAGQVALLWNLTLLLRQHVEPWRKTVAGVAMESRFEPEARRS